ncbi:MAG: hypothetical protein Q8P99_02055 [bacterium]|nr:hypothetical protein [bacterium]
MENSDLLRKSILTMSLSFVTGFAYTFLYEALSKSMFISVFGIILFSLAILVCVITSKFVGRAILAWVWSAFLFVGLIAGDKAAIGLGVGINDVSGLFITLTVASMVVLSTIAFLVTFVFTKKPEKEVSPITSSSTAPSSGMAFLSLTASILLFAFIFAYVKYPLAGIVPLVLGFGLAKSGQKKLANGTAIAIFIFTLIPVLTGGLWSFNSVINELFFPLTYPLLIAMGGYVGGLRPKG